MHFNIMHVTLLYYGQRHVSASHVAIFMVISVITRIQMQLKYVKITPQYYQPPTHVQSHNYLSFITIPYPQ
jgi:hypothetical protein